MSHVGLVKSEFIDLSFLSVNFFFKFRQLIDQLGNLIVLTKRKTTTIFDNLVKLSNLILETLDNLPSLLFLLFGSLN